MEIPRPLRRLLSLQRAPKTGGSRAELWRWPSVGAVLGLAAALLLTELLPLGTGDVTWPGDVSSAQSLLQTVAGAAVTILTLSFTLTVIAMQLASQQFSPRLMRGFMRDRMTKAVLAVLVAVFVYAVTTLRRLDPEAPVPGVAMLVALLGGLAAMFSVIAFISHLARQLRVETMMVSLHKTTSDAIRRFYPEYDSDELVPVSELEHGDDPTYGEDVRAEESGFVRLVDVDGLLEAARDCDAFARIDVRPGDQVVRGTPVASVWARDGQGDLGPLVEAVRSGVILDYERSIDQDAAFGFRQLEDIAVKALSPGINDPVTATHALGHMADLLVRLCGRRLGPSAHRDEDGTARVIVADRDYRYYLDLAVEQVRRYGAHEPTVQVALLRMLRDMAAACRDEEQRHEVRRQVRRIVEHLPDELSKEEVAPVHELAERVERALNGDLRGAYFDRSGETRSL